MIIIIPPIIRLIFWVFLAKKSFSSSCIFQVDLNHKCFQQSSSTPTPTATITKIVINITTFTCTAIITNITYNHYDQSFSQDVSLCYVLPFFLREFPQKMLRNVLSCLTHLEVSLEFPDTLKSTWGLY